jgi:hypothetical protein
MSRRRIQVAPTPICNKFRFDPHATAVVKEYDAIWARIKFLAIVSISAATISLCMIILITLEGYRKQSQEFMTALYTLCLLGLFFSVILIWDTRSFLYGTYQAPHEHFAEAVKLKCVTNPSWSDVLSTWNEHTSFAAGFGTQLTYGLIMCATLLAAGLLFAVYALMNLSRNNEVGRQRELDYDY